MKRTINASKLIAVAAVAMLILTGCEIKITPNKPAETSKPQNNISVQNVAYEEEVFPQLSLAVLPDSSTARQIELGMPYVEVLELLGPPVVFGAISSDGVESEHTYLWTFADKKGFAEITILFVGDSVPIVSDILIKDSSDSTEGQLPQAEPAITLDDGAELEFAIVRYEWYSDYGVTKVYYELTNPNPFEIEIKDETLYLNGVELSSDDYFIWLKAKANSKSSDSFTIKKPVNDGDTLVITGILENDAMYDNIGTVEFTLLFESGSAEVVGHEVFMPFDNVTDGLDFTYLGYVQGEDYIEIYFDFVNSNPFSIYIGYGEATVFFNDAELSRLDWSIGLFLDADSTRRSRLRVYRAVEAGDHIVVNAPYHCSYSGKMEVIEFEVTILGIAIP